VVRLSIPERLVQRFDDLGTVLARRRDAIALIGLGSVGTELGRLDDHSDLDFFVVVDAGRRQRYLDSVDWLEELAPVAYSFANTLDGRKVLFGDRLYAEYAVFTLDGLAARASPAGRVVWQRSDAPAGLEASRHLPRPSPYDSVQWQANEALTNLYVGLHRDARGETLARPDWYRSTQSIACSRSPACSRAQRANKMCSQWSAEPSSASARTCRSQRWCAATTGTARRRWPSLRGLRHTPASTRCSPMPSAGSPRALPEECSQPRSTGRLEGRHGVAISAGLVRSQRIPL